MRRMSFSKVRKPDKIAGIGDVFKTPTPASSSTSSNSQQSYSSDSSTKTADDFVPEEVSETDIKKVVPPECQKPREAPQPSSFTSEPSSFSSASSCSSFPSFGGFSTGSGKAVSISSDALAKTKKMFQDIENDLGGMCVKTEYSKSEPAFQGAIGFTTGGGKKVSISEEAMAKSKKLLEENSENDNSKPMPSTSSASKVQNFGFSIAGSGKLVTISNDALAKTKKLFEDIDQDDNFKKPTTSSFQNFGFSTGSGKAVSISNEALAKTKKIFDDLGEGTEFSLNTFSFSTAKGNITKEALETAKRKLDDATDNNDYKKIKLESSSDKEQEDEKQELQPRNLDKEDAFADDFDIGTQALNEIEAKAYAEINKENKEEEIRGLSDGLAEGASVAEATVMIARKYPVVYRVENKSTGKKETVSQAVLDECSSVQSDDDRAYEMEKIYHEVRAEFEKRERQNQRKPLTRSSASKSLVKQNDIKKLTYGKDIHDAIENSPDPANVQSCLTSEQVRSLEDYKRSEWERLHAEMKTEVEKRLAEKVNSQSSTSKFMCLPGDKVTPLLKVRVVDVATSTRGSLFIWRPNEDLANSMKENAVVRVLNLTVGHKDNGELQLKTSKETRFQEANDSGDGDNFDKEDFVRTVTNIEDLVSDVFDNPVFNEVDVLGVVVKIEKDLKAGFQAVYLCDSLFNFVSVQFYGGLRKASLDKIINKPGKILLCSNLQWRDSSSSGNFFESQRQDGKVAIPCLYANEFTVIKTKTGDKIRSNMMKELADEIESIGEEEFLATANKELSQLSVKKIIKIMTPRLMTPSTPALDNCGPGMLDVGKNSVEGSPAFYQSMRTKQILTKLGNIPDPPTPLRALAGGGTPVSSRTSGQFKTPLRNNIL